MMMVAGDAGDSVNVSFFGTFGCHRYCAFSSSSSSASVCLSDLIIIIMAARYGANDAKGHMDGNARIKQIILAVEMLNEML